MCAAILNKTGVSSAVGGTPRWKVQNHTNEEVGCIKAALKSRTGKCRTRKWRTYEGLENATPGK